MSFFQWFIKSLYERKVIAYSRFRQMVSTIWHILFVVFIASIPFFVQFNVQMFQGVNHLEQTLQHDLPPFSIQNGKLYTNESESFHLVHGDVGSIIIDPNAKSSNALDQHVKGIALVSDKVIILDRGQVQAIPYTLLGIQNLSNEDLVKKVSDLKSFLPVLLIIMTIGSYLGLLGTVFLGITVLGAFGLLLRGKRNLPYRQLWVMTAHALTFPLIVLYWIDTLLFSVPTFIFLLATYIVLYVAIRTIPLPKGKQA